MGKEFDPGRRRFIEKATLASGGILLDRRIPDPIIIFPQTEPMPETKNKQALREKKRITEKLRRNPSLLETHVRAVKETRTTIPPSVLMGVHYREADMVSSLDLQSGAALGDRSLLDSSKQLIRELKEKVDLQDPRDPKNFKELVKALALYNGPGNRNYDRSPYQHEPKFYGEDHNYVMNFWPDGKHEKMYVIYCNDGEKCPPGSRDMKVGAVTMAAMIDPFSFTSGRFKKT